MGWSLDHVLVGTVLAENGYIYEELEKHSLPHPGNIEKTTKESRTLLV